MHTAVRKRAASLNTQRLSSDEVAVARQLSRREIGANPAAERCNVALQLAALRNMCSQCGWLHVQPSQFAALPSSCNARSPTPRDVIHIFDLLRTYRAPPASMAAAQLSCQR
jgi:hypothetical protein